MPRIGVLYGMEESFPPALVDHINARGVSGVTAEHLKVGGVAMAAPCGYDVIVDRISHDIPFYRSYLKNAVLTGTQVINNPFWWSADDKFFNYALAAKLGVAVPPTVLLPHKKNPTGTTGLSMRNLEYPLDWDGIFRYVGFPAFLKPHDGGGWKNVYKVDTPEELFAAYDARLPHHLRYVAGNPPPSPVLGERMATDALKLCRALGYDLNTVEFAVEDGIPYAIDFMNPAPDADLHSVGQESFDWIVNAVANLAVKKAQSADKVAPQM